VKKHFIIAEPASKDERLKTLEPVNCFWSSGGPPEFELGNDGKKLVSDRATGKCLQLVSKCHQDCHSEE
jgi:hypothetical protein